MAVYAGVSGISAETISNAITLADCIWLRPYACATVHQYQVSLIQPNAFYGTGQTDGIEAATGADGIIF
jgi:hypothetical protein